MMYYLGIILKVLFAELAGVAAMTGILYIYWNILRNRKKTISN